MLKKTPNCSGFREFGTASLETPTKVQAPTSVDGEAAMGVVEVASIAVAAIVEPVGTLLLFKSDNITFKLVVTIPNAADVDVVHTGLVICILSVDKTRTAC